jgi:SAM-dependent methyltransferase
MNAGEGSPSAAPHCKRRKLTDDNLREKAVEWRIYPPKKRTCALFPKESSVAAKDGKTYQKGMITETDSRKNTVTVTIDGSVSKVLHIREQKRRLLPLFQNANQSIIVTPETNFFRQMAISQISQDDRVLEIGCSTGETSKLFIPICQSWVGVDTSEKMIAQCKQMIQENNFESTNTHLEQVDALIDPAKALSVVTHFGEPSVIFIDIGGNRECINVLRMLSWARERFPNNLRLVVVKSRELTQSMQSLANSETGILDNGNEWFTSTKHKPKLVKHPLKAPMMFSPIDPTTPICRYHNYHKNGCHRAICPLDHVHCHACQQPGHIAKECPKLIS